MDSETAMSADFFRWVAWAHARRKQLTWYGVGVLVVALAIGLYFWNRDRREEAASVELSSLRMFVRPNEVEDPAGYLKVANDYSGTRGGARALLAAAAILFEKGQYTDAQANFERFLSQYSDSPMASGALIGIAACMAGEGKTQEAATRYKDFIDRHPDDPVLSEARSALARLYVALNKPELALRVYEDMVKARSNDSWTEEASLQGQELLRKYPNLRTPPPTAALPAPAVGVPSAANSAVPLTLTSGSTAPTGATSGPAAPKSPSPTTRP
jgi:outer membrane protein assembly factor BamD (BamD/ComL family)